MLGNLMTIERCRRPVRRRVATVLLAVGALALGAPGGVQAEPAGSGHTATSRTAAPRLNRWQRVYTAAHRGDVYGPNVGHTEDTLGSFRAMARFALRQHRRTGRPLSSFALELDLRPVRNNDTNPYNDVVVLHDATLDRTTTCRGPVATRTYGQLRHCYGDLAGTGDPAADRRVPTFKRIAVLAANYHLTIVPELKARSMSTSVQRRIKRILQGEGLARHAIVQSFYRRNLLRWRAVAPGIPAAYVRGSRVSATYVRRFASWVFYRQSAVSRSSVASAHRAGLRVGVWTPWSKSQFRSDVGDGVNMVITDHVGTYTRLVNAS